MPSRVLSQVEIERRLSAAGLADCATVSDDGDGWFTLTVRATTNAEAKSRKLALYRELAGIGNVAVAGRYHPPLGVPPG